MDRRKFLIGVGGASIGTSALVGSNAFSSIGADRSLSVNVVEDPNAYLGIDNCPESPNSAYADFGSGRIAVDLTETDNGGEGVNTEALTYMDDVFQLCNQGTQTVEIWIEKPEGWPDVDGEPRVNFYPGQRGTSILGQENAQTIPVGECICVGIKIDTEGIDTPVDDLFEDIDLTLIADDNPTPTGPPESSCEPCTVNESDGTEDFLSIDSIDASGFPNIEIEARVETSAGRAGDLEDAFTVCEDISESGSVSISGSGAGGSSNLSDPNATASFAEEDSEGLADVMIVLDRSGSMSGTAMDNAKAGAKNLVDALGSEAEVGLVSFSNSATIDAALGTPKADVKTAIGNITAGGGTDMIDGISLAQSELDDSRPDAPDFMVVLGDGDVDPDDVTEADDAKTKGTTIYSIGYGGNVDVEYKDVASTPTDEFAFEAGEEDIAQVFQDIGSSISDTYVITYEACDTDASDPREVLVYVEDPDEGVSTATDTYSQMPLT